MSRGGPTYLGERFSYWGGVDNLYSMAFNDNNLAYINASADDQSQASDRYEEGVAAGERFLAALESGNEALADGETIKIVGHSQGGAFAAGMAAAISKSSKYGGLLETVHYLSPHQPGGFSHPSGVNGVQFSTQSDKISSKRNVLFGNSNLTRIDGIGYRDYMLRRSHEGDHGGHSVNTYLDYLVGYFRGLGIPVTVRE